MQFSSMLGNDCHGVSCMECWGWMLDTGIGTMIGLQWRRTLQQLSIGELYGSGE